MERAENSRRGSRDRISSFPDCLIHLIMSFLTAQQAVQMSILSKRWKNLWTTLPFLDFDLWKFKDDEESEDGYNINKFEKFRDFVSATLLLRKASDLHKFRLSCCHNYHMLIRSWILYALEHNPKVFHMDIRPASLLPLGVFTCASLVDASLILFASVQTVKLINLPCLRRLHLGTIELNQGFIEKLFCGCPLLEFLHLEDCWGEYSAINSRSLKHLKIEYIDLVNEMTRMELINTPNLLSFCCDVGKSAIGHKILLKMPSLTSANICSDGPYKGMNNILMGLSNVQSLKLSGRAVKEILENELGQFCPMFSNVKKLSVDDLCLSCHFNLFASFLNHFPNLERLSLHHTRCSFEEEVDENQESLKIAPFKGRRLETVDVMFMRNDKCAPLVVKYLQDITEKSRALISITTSVYDWSPEDWDVDSSEEAPQESN